MDVAGFDAHAAVGLQRGECVDEGGVAQAAGVAKLAAGQRGRGVAEGVQDALGGRARALGRRRADVLTDMQREPAATIGELELEARRRRRRAVLDRQQQALAVTTQIEIAVTPRVQLRRSAQRLAGAGAAALARVVDQRDGAAERALQLAQIGEQRRDLGGGVLINAVQADEWVEDDESRPQVFDLGEQPCAVGRDVEADDRIDDDVDIEAVPGDLCRCADPLQARARCGARPRRRRAAPGRAWRPGSARGRAHRRRR